MSNRGAPAAWAAEIERVIARGNALEDSGDLDQALACYRAAAVQAPGWPRSHLNIGNVLQRQRKLDEAVAAYRAALAIDACFVPALFNLGMLHATRGDLDAAERELRESRRLAPGMADAAIALASVLESRGRLDDAERELHSALAIDARHVGALHNLRLLLNQQGKWDEGLNATLQAVAMDPTCADACAELANQYFQLGRLNEADAMYRQALLAQPTSVPIHSERLFALNCRDDLDATAIFCEHQAFATACERGIAPATPFPPRDADGERRLRIGYVSGDFRRHPVALFLLPVLRHHDRGRFEVFCYSNNDADDELTAEIAARADAWRDIARHDDAAAARIIHADRIDVLVDLAGHTPKSRVLLFARRCARVQATWLGYLNTTGLATADFRICDRHTDPPGSSEHLHTERLYRMPESQWCFAPVYDIPTPGPPHPDEPGRVVFGSFNQFVKISPSCLDLWCDVLRASPGSELQVLGVPEGETRHRFLAEVERRGVDRRRVTLRPRLAIGEYFAAISDVDIALDTTPYNGATTTLDTLWMGVPLVALPGQRGIERGSFSMLQTLGASGLIAANRAEFVSCNVALARDHERRCELRRSLRRQLEGSPLMDAQRFTRELERAYRDMLSAIGETS